MKSAIDESAIVAITDKSGTITYANRKFCAISKYSLHELIGQNHRILNSGFHSREFFVEMWTTISSGKVWEGEIRNRAKDGSNYWVHTTIVPFADESGRPEQYVAVRYDITERKLAERDLREREDNFRTLLNSTFEGIVVHNHGVITDANSAAGEIFGLPFEDLHGKTLSDLVREDQFDRLKNMKERSPIEIWGRRSDGHEVPLELSARKVVLKGQEQMLVAVRDLTERRQMEAQILQQDRLASLGLLASSLAHEIGTPLGVIRGRAEMADVKAGDNAPVRQSLGIIITQIDRIAKLVDGLLHLARGKEENAVATVDVQLVIQDVVNLVQHEFSRKGIELKVQLAPQLRIRGEAGLLGQVLLNLLVNAIHAIEAGRKRGQLGEAQVEISGVQKGDFVEIAVRDSGCGIPEKNLTQLFKPFFTTKDIGQGTGLGLATSFNIVHSWGGSISAKSREGQGATFTLELKHVVSQK